MAAHARPSLEDEAVVVRGGSTQDRTAVEAAARRAKRDIGLHGISGSATGQTDVDGVFKEAGLPNKRGRATTAGRLRVAGFDVIPTRGHPHVTIILPEPITDEAWHALQSVFDPPQANPYPRT